MEQEFTLITKKMPKTLQQEYLQPKTSHSQETHPRYWNPLLVGHSNVYPILLHQMYECVQWSVVYLWWIMGWDEVKMPKLEVGPPDFWKIYNRMWDRVWVCRIASRRPYRSYLDRGREIVPCIFRCHLFPLCTAPLSTVFSDCSSLHTTQQGSSVQKVVQKCQNIAVFESLCTTLQCSWTMFTVFCCVQGTFESSSTMLTVC